MNPSTLEIIVILSVLLSYVVNLYFVFNLLRVNYFNPIVKIFVKIFTPISKVFFFIPNQVVLAFMVMVSLRFLGTYISDEDVSAFSNLIFIAFLETILITLQIFLLSIFGGVIISWVAQGNEHPMLRLIEEISYKTLYPIKNVIPAMGGLDISPLFGLIIIQYLQAFIEGLIQSLS